LSRIYLRTRLRLSPRGEGEVGGPRGAPQSRVEDERAHCPRLRLHRSLFRILGLFSHIQVSFHICAGLFPWRETCTRRGTHTHTHTHTRLHTHTRTHTHAHRCGCTVRARTVLS